MKNLPNLPIDLFANQSALTEEGSLKTSQKNHTLKLVMAIYAKEQLKRIIGTARLGFWPKAGPLSKKIMASNQHLHLVNRPTETSVLHQTNRGYNSHMDQYTQQSFTTSRVRPCQVRVVRCYESRLLSFVFSSYFIFAFILRYFAFYKLLPEVLQVWFSHCIVLNGAFFHCTNRLICFFPYKMVLVATVGPL